MRTLLDSIIRGVVVTGFILGAGAAGQNEQDSGAKQYPRPRFPSYVTQPNSSEEVKVGVRGLVRNKSGYQGFGMGVVQGERVWPSSRRLSLRTWWWWGSAWLWKSAE